MVLLPLHMMNLLEAPAPPVVATTPAGAATGVGQFGHSKSNRPGEYVRLTHVQPSGLPIARYDLDLSEPGHHPSEPPPILVNPVTLLQESPPLLVPLSPGSAVNPLDEASKAYTNGVSTQVIWFSKRHAIVNRWRTVLGAPHNIDVEWMAEAGPAGIGLTSGNSVTWSEYVGTAAHSDHNPTQAGARILPVDDTPAAADELNSAPSVPIYSKVTDTSLEGAHLPVEFLDGPNVPASPHNTDSTHVALYWRRRQYERLTPHVSGSEFVHEVVKFFYSPLANQQVDFDNVSLESTAASKFSYTAASKRSVMDGLGFDEGWYADLGRDTALKSLESAFTGVTFDVTSDQRFIFTKDSTSYTGVAGNQTVGSLFPSGSGVLAHSRSSDGFAVAIGGILVSSPDLSEVTTFELQNGESSVRVVSVSTPHHSHGSGKALHCRTTVTDRRPAGWLGYRYYLFTGPLSEVLNAMKAVPMSSNPQPKLILPPVVRQGTEAADPADAIAIDAKLIRKSQARFFNSRLN